MKIKPHSVEEIASIIGVPFIGDGKIKVSGLNEVHRVEHGDIMFVDHPKYYEKALNSAASVVLINKEVECPAGKALLISQEPFTDFNRLVTHFQPENFSLKPIADSATVGEGTVIHPGVYIGNNVRIGKNCVLMPNVAIYNNTIIGDNVRIHANTVIGSDAFYYKKRATHYERLISCGNVIIHDDVEIGAGCTIDRGVSASTVIGKGTKLDNRIHIGHDTEIGEMCLFAASVAIAGVVTIGNKVTLWGGVLVSSDLSIGDGAVVLGSSAVSKDLEGGKTYFGAPAIDARDKWKEMAMMRQLPEIVERMKK